MESWPETVAEVEFDAAAIADHLRRVQSMLTERGIDALFVTSADRWLNEYTPRDDNHRYWLSGFTGSTAYLLVPAEGRAKLFVDGRYHIQADQEADPSIIEVVKVPFGTLLQTAALDAIVYAKIVPKLRGDDSPRFRAALDETKKVAKRHKLKRCLSKLEELEHDLTTTGSARFWR